MKEFGDKIEFFKTREARGEKTHLSTLPKLKRFDHEFWEGFVLLYPQSMTFSEVRYYCDYVGIPDVLEYFIVLREIESEITDGIDKSKH